MENYENLGWVVLFAPLAAVAAILLFARDKPRLSAQISISAALISFISSVVLYGFLRSAGSETLPQASVQWLWVGDLAMDIGLRLDNLSLMMALIVTGVGSVIHIYSAGYMKGDRGYSRYFAFLSLFTFSMLGIVLADNFVMMFIFWELVGVSSYLLIGHWYERPAAADACKKAFLTNRLGDFGFLAGILLVGKPGGTVWIGGHGGGVADFLRRDGEVGAISAARVAAGRDGRTDAGERVDPRGDDGGGGCLHALPGVLPVELPGFPCAGGDRVDRRIHGAAGGGDCGAAK